MTALSDKKTEWQPSASIQNLLARAKIIADIRQFFTERGLLEVETPVLSEFGVTDLHLSTFNTEFVAPFDELSKTLWLSTSPEYHMKRLLAAGSGPIFQIGKVFRNEEAGNRHNPEFTMLEWYRPHFDMYRLMNEVDDLLQQILDCKPAETLSYQFVFQEYVGLDPLSATRQELVEAARKHNFMADKMKIVIPYYNFYSVKWWSLKLGKRRLLRFIISLLPKLHLHSLAQKIAVWQNVLSSIIKA